MGRDVTPVASQKLKDENGKLKVCRDVIHRVQDNRRDASIPMKWKRIVDVFCRCEVVEICILMKLLFF